MLRKGKRWSKLGKFWYRLADLAQGESITIFFLRDVFWNAKYVFLAFARTEWCFVNGESKNTNQITDAAPEIHNRLPLLNRNLLKTIWKMRISYCCWTIINPIPIALRIYSWMNILLSLVSGTIHHITPIRQRHHPILIARLRNPNMATTSLRNPTVPREVGPQKYLFLQGPWNFRSYFL